MLAMAAVALVSQTAVPPMARAQSMDADAELEELIPDSAVTDPEGWAMDTEAATAIVAEEDDPDSPMVDTGFSLDWPEDDDFTVRIDDIEPPTHFWVPSIAPSGLTFYTGDRFPQWKGNLFVGSMMVWRRAQAGHLERIVFNPDGEELRREWLLTELKQRIRDVRQGPDGYLYILTEEDDAVLLRLEPG